MLQSPLLSSSLKYVDHPIKVKGVQQQLHAEIRPHTLSIVYNLSDVFHPKTFKSTLGIFNVLELRQQMASHIWSYHDLHHVTLIEMTLWVAQSTIFD